MVTVETVFIILTARDCDKLELWPNLPDTIRII